MSSLFRVLLGLTMAFSMATSAAHAALSDAIEQGKLNAVHQCIDKTASLQRTKGARNYSFYA